MRTVGVAGMAGVSVLIADPGRLRALVALLEGEMCVCDLATVAGGSELAASHYQLRAHRVVHARRSGQMARCRLAGTDHGMLLDVALTRIDHAPAAACLGHDQPAPRRHLVPGGQRRTQVGQGPQQVALHDGIELTRRRAQRVRLDRRDAPPRASASARSRPSIPGDRSTAVTS